MSLVRRMFRGQRSANMPKVVLFLGNGFTIGYAVHLGIAEDHNTGTLIPPPAFVQEHSSVLFRGERGPMLWCQDRYPELFNAWHALMDDDAEASSSRSFHRLCESISTSTSYRIGPDPVDGPFMLIVASDPGYQLRLYLWHLFFFYNGAMLRRILGERTGSAITKEILYAAFRASAVGFGLFELVLELARKCDLTLVSFNYDAYVETLLNAHGMAPHLFLQRCSDKLDTVTDAPVRLIKPHGSMSVHYPRLVDAEMAADIEAVRRNPNFEIMHAVYSRAGLITRRP